MGAAVIVLILTSVTWGLWLLDIKDRLVRQWRIARRRREYRRERRT